MKINAIIERANDGGYWAYSTEESADNVLGCGFIGFGNTPAEAMEDLKLSIRELKENERPDLPDIEVDFKYDVSSFLRSFKSQMSLSGLERITGVNQRQLQQYLSGARRPSASTVQKIQAGIADFARELASIQFA